MELKGLKDYPNIRIKIQLPRYSIKQCLFQYHSQQIKAIRNLLNFWSRKTNILKVNSQKGVFTATRRVKIKVNWWEYYWNIPLFV